MQVFLNLDRIHITARDTEQAWTVPPLSTKFALPFMRYPLRIASVGVTYIPLINLDQALMEFYNQERIIKKFSVYYKHNTEASRGSSYMSVWTYKKYKMFISINYAKVNSKPILPRIGMIEHNGDFFQDINVDIGFDFDSIDLLVANSTQEEDCLSSILSKCLNLKSISVAYTMLRSFGASLQQQKIPFLQRLELDRSLVYGSFLLDMLFHLPFIDQFIISECQFDGETEKNVTINMSDTKFTKILYIDDSIDIDKVYLKLTTLESNTTCWYVVKSHLCNTCTENEYQHSLQNTKSLSLFIKCKQTDSFRFKSMIYHFNIQTSSK